MNCRVIFGAKFETSEYIDFPTLHKGAIAALKLAHVLGLRPAKDLCVSRRAPRKRIENATYYVEVIYLIT